MSSISFIQYDSTGNIISTPVPVPVSTRVNKFRKFDFSSIQPVRVPVTPPVVIIPEYRGQFRSRMEEWSYLQTGKPTNPPKFYADRLNKTHDAFLANGVELDVDSEDEGKPGVDLELYMFEIVAYLERDFEHSDVLAFMETIQDKLQAGTFCPIGARPKFATRLNNSWRAYSAINCAQPAPTEQQERPEPSPADSAPPVVVGDKPQYKALKKRDNRAAIVGAYSGYIEGIVTESDFFAAVRKFILAKISWKLKDLAKLSQTEEDVVQEIVLAVIKNLPNFKGVPEQFYSWLHRIVFTRGLDAKHEAEQEQDRHAFLFVELEDEDGGEPEMVDNPAMRGEIRFKCNGRDSYQDARPQYRRKLPDFIQGVDLQICNYIREDYSYAKIARILCMTEAAVKQRVACMRKTVEEMRARGKKV